MTRQTHQIQITNVNTETEISAKDPNGILHLLPVSFRRLVIHTGDTKLWLTVMN